MEEKTKRLTVREQKMLQEEYRQMKKCQVCSHLLFKNEVVRGQKVCDCCVREAMEAECFKFKEDTDV